MLRPLGSRALRIGGGAFALALLLAACDSEDDRVLFDGVSFRAKTSKVGEDRTQFSAVVFKALQSIDSAREAGRYEGTKYCIKNYGSSRIDWTLGPDDPEEALQIRDGDLLLQGRCAP